MFNHVEIKVIPHKQQRYETLGDWVVEDDKLTLFISDCGDWRYNMLIGFHELAEALLCRARGVEQAAVDKFDIEFEKERARLAALNFIDLSEPGDDLDAPYYDEHQFATTVERQLCQEFGIKWHEYEDALAEI